MLTVYYMTMNEVDTHILKAGIKGDGVMEIVKRMGDTFQMKDGSDAALNDGINRWAKSRGMSMKDWAFFVQK